MSRNQSKEKSTSLDKQSQLVQKQQMQVSFGHRQTPQQSCLDLHRRYSSQFRLVDSQYFSIQLAVNYLFLWRSKMPLVQKVLTKLLSFDREKLVFYLPTIMYIMSLGSHEAYDQHFTQKIASQSLNYYLLIRWGLSTYWKNKNQREILQNKLDSSVIKCYALKGIQLVSNNNTQQTNETAINAQEKSIIHENIQSKFIISEYTSLVNQFYQRIFHLPEKLKKYEKQKRKQKLTDYLTKFQNKYLAGQLTYLKGIIFPIQSESSYVARIIPEYCFPFSTKQRVPFKLVFQTVSQEDLRSIQQENSQLQNSLNNSLLVQLKERQSIKHKKRSQNSIQQAVPSDKNLGLMLPHTYFGEYWNASKEKIRAESPFSQLSSYKIRAYMVKSGDDLRQEYLAMQLIKMVASIFERQNLKLWIKTYEVIPYDCESGLIEFVDDTRTISFLKEVSGEKSLRRIYHQLFLDNVDQAMLNFVKSLAGYSVVQYLFQIKDRHNNNIMIDREGHMIHIDFSFMISSSPGNMGFEKAPFKMVTDYIDLMEGPQSDLYRHFQMLFFFGLKYIRKYRKQIMDALEMMVGNQDMKCFSYYDKQAMIQRFHENETDQHLQSLCNKLIADSWNSRTTGGYDYFQWYTNAIHS